MKHTIEEIDEIESLMFEEKQKLSKIALTNVLWSFLAVEFGYIALNDMNIINCIFTLISTSFGAKTYLRLQDTKDLIKEYDKELKRLKK